MIVVYKAEFPNGKVYIGKREYIEINKNNSTNLELCHIFYNL